MKKLLAIIMLATLFVTMFANVAEARGRYGSTRIGGYTSNGKGSHYIGGHVRSCTGFSCR